LSLTDVGRTYYDYSARIVGEVEDAERAVSTLQEAPRGLLRVTAPLNMSFLAPIVSDYLARYREVQLEFFATSRRVDLVEERFDIGIRAGVLADSTLIARSLGTAAWFWSRRRRTSRSEGRPKSPDDLKRHGCLLFGTAASPLRLERGDEHAQVSLATRLLSNDSDVLYAAADSRRRHRAAAGVPVRRGAARAPLRTRAARLDGARDDPSTSSTRAGATSRPR
jgi:DNA-binding transcriptional LysR family regulator